jgi:hypothetical protein
VKARLESYVPSFVWLENHFIRLQPDPTQPHSVEALGRGGVDIGRIVPPVSAVASEIWGVTSLTPLWLTWDLADYDMAVFDPPLAWQ